MLNTHVASTRVRVYGAAEKQSTRSYRVTPPSSTVQTKAIVDRDAFVDEIEYVDEELDTLLGQQGIGSHDLEENARREMSEDVTDLINTALQADQAERLQNKKYMTSKHLDDSPILFGMRSRQFWEIPSMA